MRISCFRAKAHRVFHWWIYDDTTTVFHARVLWGLVLIMWSFGIKTTCFTISCKMSWKTMLSFLPKPVNNLICCKTGLIWVVKRATSLFNSFCSNVARQDTCFLWSRTKHGARIHGPLIWMGLMDIFFKKESKGEMNNKHYGCHQATEISQTRFGGVDRWYLLSFPVSLSIFEFVIASSWDTSW